MLAFCKYDIYCLKIKQKLPDYEIEFYVILKQNYIRAEKHYLYK